MEWSRIKCSFLSLSHVARNWQTAVRLLKSQAQHNQAKNQKSRHGLQRTQRQKICFYWNVFNSNMNEFLYSQSNSIA